MGRLKGETWLRYDVTFHLKLFDGCRKRTHDIITSIRLSIYLMWLYQELQEEPNNLAQLNRQS